ncbi:uncharacterized protein MELLADRAFT_90334 [Melampsora larici-populina 98AG31]|uniref:laccase n=1 Tax=Melampsora larici-populina (strain 98AG31 / pathotype 3-4-7) TaxID=747676 RepID=F4RWK1_MELLP|nr:uncharacterized protein MELLADRAFT_90334 [Melampsora larici-populina 98AG31]EGG03305.1 hypothetical protein MELLADRAFT_90334 [Melampsora larici-populina 98AG31]
MKTLTRTLSFIKTFAFVLLILSWTCGVAKAHWHPNAILRISKGFLAGDCTVRPSVIINGTSPGPELRFKEGQRVWIRVYNDLPDQNTTLHFHGLSQFGSPFADGTPATSQFQLESGSAGTYMYHTHVDFQLVTAHGAFIVEDEGPPPYSYDEELTLLFATPFQWPGEPSSLTVNGNALAHCDPSRGYRCSGECHQHVMNLKPSRTYRVRFIGITALTFLYIGLEDHHEFEIIEADAAYLKPTRTDHLELHSGQRYSFLLRTKSRAELRALNKTTFWGRIESRWRPIRDKGSFVITYDRGYEQELATFPPRNLARRVFLPDERVSWVNRAFAPLRQHDVSPTEQEVTRRIMIRAQQLTTAGGGSQYFVNGQAAYLNPSSLQPDYGQAEVNHGYDSSTSSFPLRLGETVEIVIFNFASSLGEAEAHPWHFHGQHPFMVAQGYGKYSPEAARRIEAQNFVKYGGLPHRRDTQVILPGQGATYEDEKIAEGTLSSWIVLRMRVSVSGAFLVHCHIQRV